MGPAGWGTIPGKAQPGGNLRVLFLALLPLSPLIDAVINSSEEKNKYVYVAGGFLAFCLSSFIRKVEIKGEGHLRSELSVKRPRCSQWEQLGSRVRPVSPCS